MSASRPWLEYFRANQTEPAEIPWDRLTPPPAPLRAPLIASLQQFQLGENAPGLHFLELARRHAQSTGDADFPETIALFIAEEQRHSRLLACYLHRLGAPLLPAHWTHSAFRHIRHWAGLELKVRVLVTTEIMAVPYYRAVMAASTCPALTAICRRILREESRHLRFQGATLARLEARRPRLQRALAALAHQAFLAGTCLVTWLEHRPIFRASGHTLATVWRTARAALVHVWESPACPRTPIV